MPKMLAAAAALASLTVIAPPLRPSRSQCRHRRPAAERRISRALSAVAHPVAWGRHECLAVRRQRQGSASDRHPDARPAGQRAQPGSCPGDSPRRLGRAYLHLSWRLGIAGRFLDRQFDGGYRRRAGVRALGWRREARHRRRQDRPCRTFDGRRHRGHDGRHLDRPRWPDPDRRVESSPARPAGEPTRARALARGFDDFGNSLHGATPDSVAAEVDREALAMGPCRSRAAARRPPDPLGQREIWLGAGKRADDGCGPSRPAITHYGDRNGHRSFLFRPSGGACLRPSCAGSTRFRSTASPPRRHQRTISSTTITASVSASQSSTSLSRCSAGIA